MEARASAEARGATRAGTGVFSGGRWDAVRVVFLHGGGVRGAGGGVACMQGAAARKASCLAESGVVQPGLHTRYVGTCDAAPVSSSLRGGGDGCRWGRPSLLFDGRCLGAPGCTRVCPVAVVYPV